MISLLDICSHSLRRALDLPRGIHAFFSIGPNAKLLLSLPYVTRVKAEKFVVP
jgi:hypothetical protein